MRVAKIHRATAVVENVELWETLPAEAADFLYVESDTADPGFTHASGEFSPPEPSEPPNRSSLS